MIIIKNLTKIYESNKNKVKALDNISLTLENKGLVFILGKSGSGKSTFLNMLGGLDTATSGDILVNGTSIVELSETKLEMYRNDYVGIIYQNFNLFPNDSVFSNIREAAIISNKKINNEKIIDLCRDLDLLGKENEFVKNLSGGQKQRVAIARALIKDPKLILADEPTGNLDSKTTNIIFDTLKRIAKEKLVIVISHDIESAKKYADRIIYLSDGKVMDDVIRNSEYKLLSENSLKLPVDSNFSDEEIVKINECLKKYDLKAERNNEEFIKNDKKVDMIDSKLELSKRKKNFKLSLGITNKFFYSTILSFISTVLMLTFIIGILSISHSLSQFDNNRAVKSIAQMYGNKSFVINKAYSYYNDGHMNKNYHVKVKDEDIERFKEAGYKGNIFKLYNTPIITGSVNLSNEKGVVSSREDQYYGIYAQIAFGTLICDYEYLKSLFGDLKVIAGSLKNTENSSKLIVTDYFADSILVIDRITNTNEFISKDLKNPYSKILNKILWNRYQIGAIIDTGYKQRYKEIIEKFKKVELEPQNQNEIIKELMKMPDSLKLYEELSTSLNFTYSVNQNFYQDYLKETDNLAIWLRNSIIEYTNGSYNGDLHVYSNSSLEKNSVKLTVELYNQLFDMNLTNYDISAFEPRVIRLKNYTIDQDTNDEPANDLNLNVVGVTNCGPGCLGMIDRESYELLANEAVFNYALVFDDVEESLFVNGIAKENLFYTPIDSFNEIFEICDIIDIFSSIFLFIVIILISIQLIIIISHNVRTIKKNQYKIGIYKSLGCPSNVFNLASLFNTILLVSITFLTSLFFVKFSSDYVNDILVEKFTLFGEAELVYSFNFVEFNLNSLLIYIGIVLIVGGISIFAPVKKLKKMKPNLILNKSE